MMAGKNIRYGARVRLDNRQAVSLPRQPRRREIACTGGVIWVTFPGDPRDYVLRKDERVMAEKNTPAVISAIGKSEFSVNREGVRAGSALQGLEHTYAT
jgi:hypothetical protein